MDLKMAPKGLLTTSNNHCVQVDEQLKKYITALSDKFLNLVCQHTASFIYTVSECVLYLFL